MPLICDCCGKKIEKYCIVKYEIDYLESYLADYFGKPFDEIMSMYQMKKPFSRIRAICVQIILQYTTLTPKMIEKRYKIKPSAISHRTMSFGNKDHDYVFLNKELSNNLPETIKYQYQK